MTVVRLHIDEQGASWAVVRCDRCRQTQRYAAALAARGPVSCACGEALDVRDDVDADVQERLHARAEEA